MLIESLIPLRVRRGSTVVELKPGHPHRFSEVDGRKLLAKVPDKVRVIGGTQMGEVVTWDSPLFGLLSATVLQVSSSGFTVIHPLTSVECTLPITWLTERGR